MTTIRKLFFFAIRSAYEVKQSLEELAPSLSFTPSTFPSSSSSPSQLLEEVIFKILDLHMISLVVQLAILEKQGYYLHIIFYCKNILMMDNFTSKILLFFFFFFF